MQNGEGTKITVSENGDYEFEVTGEQNQEYFVYAVDKACNISEAQSVYAKIDRTEPQITGFLLNGGYSTLFGNYHNVSGRGAIYLYGCRNGKSGNLCCPGGGDAG